MSSIKQMNPSHLEVVSSPRLSWRMVDEHPLGVEAPKTFLEISRDGVFQSMK